MLFRSIFNCNALGLSTLLPSAEVKWAMNPLTQAQLADTILKFQIEFKQHEAVPKAKIVSRKVPVSVDDNTQAEIVGRHIYGNLSQGILAKNYNIGKTSVHRFVRLFSVSPSKLELAKTAYQKFLAEHPANQCQTNARNQVRSSCTPFEDSPPAVLKKRKEHDADIGGGIGTNPKKASRI